MDNSLKDFIFAMKDQLMLFHLLNDEEVAQIVDFFEIEYYSTGTVIFQEGEPGDFIGFITSGTLEEKKQTQFKGREIVLARLKKGSYVGELSLANSNESRFTTVVALEDSELVLLNRKSLEALIQEFPHTGIKILKGLNQILTIRLRKSVERLTSIF